MSDAISVIVIGAGPIGERIAKLVATRASLRLAAVVDLDPAKVGREIAGVQITSSLPETADVAVLTTTSSLEKLALQIEAVVERGMAVVSTCEELAWPWVQPLIAQRIDNLARGHGVCVLGTGVNPGFVMDALPLVLTAPCESVSRVVVERVQDAALRRRPFQDKVGVGMSPSEVKEKLDAAKAGHVGLRESAAMLAAKLGLDDGAEFREERRLIIAENVVERTGRRVEPGQVLGIEQVGKQGRVELVFRAVFGEDDARDRVTIEGTPHIVVDIQGGVPGDVATAAIVVNAIPIVKKAKPGLCTMADVPLVHLA